MIPPEIFPLISSHIPLRLLPASLAALALTCRSIYPYVQPILYRRVIIKNDDHAFQLLERVWNDPPLGLLIREFHLLVDVIFAARRQKRITAIVKLHNVIARRLLPRLKYLRLALNKSGYPDDFERDLIIQCRLPHKFWANLRKCCPMLSRLSVDRAGDISGDPWVDDPQFYDLENLQVSPGITLSLSLVF